MGACVCGCMMLIRVSVLFLLFLCFSPQNLCTECFVFSTGEREKEIIRIRASSSFCSGYIVHKKAPPPQPCNIFPCKSTSHRTPFHIQSPPRPKVCTPFFLALKTHADEAKSAPPPFSWILGNVNPLSKSQKRDDRQKE